MTSINYTEVVRLARKGRRAERRSEILKDFIASTLGNAVGALLNGWMLMLAVGIVHKHWIPQMPTVGYWWAVLVVYLLRGVFSRSPDDKSKTT